MTAFLRYGATIAALLGSVALGAAQGGNPGSAGAAAMPNAAAAVQAAPGVSAPSPEAMPGVTGETMPAKYSAENARKDDIPLAVHPFAFSDEQKQAILRAAEQDRPPASTTGSAASGNPVTPPEPGSLLSELYDLHEFPHDLTDRIPALRTHKYAALGDRVLLVQPANRIVVWEIRK